VLDVSWSSPVDGAAIVGFEHNGGDNQMWYFNLATSNGRALSGTYIIRNKRNGMVIDLDYHNADIDGARIQVWGICPGNSNQSWMVEQVTGTNFYTLTNIRSNTCLELHGGNSANWTKVHGWTRNGTNAQHWYIVGNDQAGYR
jgi:hypothetical protein